MSFENLQVDAAELPRAETIDFELLPEAYARQLAFQLAIVFGPILIGSMIPGIVLMLVFGTPASFVVAGVLPLIALVIAALVVPVTLRRAKTAGFALREHDIAFRRGVVFRKVVILPFNRLQHAEVSSGPLQRRYGLATLSLYTAGASGIDLKMDGLTEEQANTLRRHVTEKSGARVDDES